MHEHFIYHYEYEVITIIIKLLTVWTIRSRARERDVFVLRKSVCTSVCVRYLSAGKTRGRERRKTTVGTATNVRGRERKVKGENGTRMNIQMFFFSRAIALFFPALLLSFYVSCTLLTPTNERIFFVFDSLVCLFAQRKHFVWFFTL